MTAELSLVKPTEQQADLTAIERVVVAGDLSKLTPEQRWDYYRGVCQSVGLNPFTKPFEYITLNGKLTLYALKGAADQLRAKHGISITQPKVELTDGLCIVTVIASDRTGRTDSELGIVACDNLRGDAKANAILKAITKAKRRVTLSMCGLGMLDETETETIPGARYESADALHESPPPVTTTPEVRDAAILTGAQPSTDKRRQQLIAKLRAGIAKARGLGIDVDDVDPSDMDDDAILETVKALGQMVKDVEAALAEQNQDDDEAF